MDVKKKFNGPMTLEERNTLSKFQDMLDDKDIDYENYDENYLIRFLRARKLDIPKAYTMFLEFIEWRAKEKIDSILSLEFEEENALKSVLPMCFHKTDKLGRPIYYSEVDLEKALKVIKGDRLCKFYVKKFESLIHVMWPICSVASNKYVASSLIIVDLKINPRMLQGEQMEFIKIFTHIGQNCYPELLGHFFMINTLPIFLGIWAIIKTFLDERTKNKIFLLGEDYKKTLLEHIAEENLPEFLGGTCKCKEGCMNSNAGPWNETNNKI